MNRFSCTLVTGFPQQHGPASLPVMSQTTAAHTQVSLANGCCDLSIVIGMDLGLTGSSLTYCLRFLSGSVVDSEVFLFIHRNSYQEQIPGGPVVCNESICYVLLVVVDSVCQDRMEEKAEGNLVKKGLVKLSQ